MFDTMTLTKIVGGFCGMLLVFLLGNFAAESIYHIGGESHDGEHHQAYTIDTGEDDAHGGDDAAEAEPDFGVLLASADPAEGEGLVRACRSCHKLEDGENGTGPHLYGVDGRAVGSVDGFGYSGSLVAVADVWDPEHLNGFLANPKAYAPGTKMSYSGMKKIEDRANLIAYLATVAN